MSKIILTGRETAIVHSDDLQRIGEFTAYNYINSLLMYRLS